MQLVIGNKNYSSWSMRPWVLMRQAEIEFDEIQLRFDAFTPESRFKTELALLAPGGRVPVLIDGPITVWDSLAIAEYLAERHPDKALWPADPADRARARSVCAEMHAGFSALRSHFPMNIEARLADVGTRVLTEQPAVRADVDRIVQIWTELLARTSGPMLFGSFSIADAYFAPVAMRFVGYGVAVPMRIARYLEDVSTLPSVVAWVNEALVEADFVAFDEPYREHR